MRTSIRQKKVADDAIKAYGALSITGEESALWKQFQPAWATAAPVNVIAIVGIIAGPLVALLLGIFLALSIPRPLVAGVKFAEVIASGDFTQKLDIDQRDEVGVLSHALNDMSLKLRDIVGAVRDSAHQVAASSEEISATSQSLAEGAQSQGGGPGRGWHHTYFRELGENRRHRERDLRHRGSDEPPGAERLDRGGQGRRARPWFRRGVQIANGSQGAMEQIRTASEKVSEMIVGLTTSMQQQVAAIKDLSKAVESVNELTQAAASSTEEMSSSTEELSGMSQELQRMMEQFKIGEGTSGFARFVR